MTVTKFMNLAYGDVTFLGPLLATRSHIGTAKRKMARQKILLHTLCRVYPTGATLSKPSSHVSPSVAHDDMHLIHQTKLALLLPVRSLLFPLPHPAVHSELLQSYGRRCDPPQESVPPETDEDVQRGHPAPAWVDGGIWTMRVLGVCHQEQARPLELAAQAACLGRGPHGWRTGALEERSALAQGFEELGTVPFALARALRRPRSAGRCFGPLVCTQRARATPR